MHAECSEKIFMVLRSLKEIVGNMIRTPWLRLRGILIVIEEKHPK